MPLMPGKSKKAFSENVKTEMDNGKPQKQALAIAYSVMRKAGHKMFAGGKCDKCAGTCKYADGGEIKDKPLMQDKSSLSAPILPGAQSAQASMRSAFGSPKKMAQGGEVGVHKASLEDEPGKSKAGFKVRIGHRNPNLKSDKMEEAKNEHTRVLGEIVKMKNPNLKGLAHGGEVTLHNGAIRSFMDKGEFDVGSSDKISPEMRGVTSMEYAKGGDVEMEKDSDGDYDGAMNHELEEMACDELFSAFKAGNKKEFMESLKALIMSMKG